MSHPHAHDHADDHCAAPGDTRLGVPQGYAKALWIALILNAGMFVIETIASHRAESTSLLADAIDFFGDAANYGVSLFVLAKSLKTRAWTAMLKGLCMAGFGLFVIGKALEQALLGSSPNPFIIGWVGLLAFAVNLTVAWILYQHRNGDANMRSVWLCTRNDAIGNISVMVAAALVWLTATQWPDVLVALGMGALALYSAVQVLRQARAELKVPHVNPDAPQTA